MAAYSLTRRAVVGPLAPLFPGMVGCVVVDAAGTRKLARVIRDPLAEQ